MMRLKLFFLSIALLGIFSGCGKIEEETDQGTAEIENENYDPGQNNTCYSNFENSAGCFGDDQYFGDEIVTDGYWSIYAQSDNYILYYDTYQYGYQFESDGSVKMRLETQEYTYSSIRLWGVNNEGSALIVDPDASFRIASKVIGTSCYKATNTSGQTIKICNESAVDTATAQNASGYYGSALRFGNYAYGDYTVAGDWNIDGTTVTLNEDGTTSNSGEWGLSADSKKLTIDNIVYLVYRYPDNSCLETFVMQGDSKTDRKTLCKL